MKKLVIVSLAAIAATTAVSAGVSALHSAVTEQPTETPQYLQNAPGAKRAQDAASGSYLQPASN